MTDIAPAPSAVPAGSPPAPVAPAVTAPPAGGSAAAPPAASPVIDWSTAPQQLRTQYETTKQEADRLRAEAERWSKLGDFDSVSKAYTNYAQNLSRTVEIGKALGYTEESLRASYEKDPTGTLNLVQQEYAKPPAQPLTREEMDRQIRERALEAVKPIQDMHNETINRDAERLYESERDRLFKAEFPDGLPDRAKAWVFKQLDDAMSADAEALSRLKFGKQISDVAKHFATVKTEYLQFTNDVVGHQRGQNGAPPKPGTPPRDTQTGRYADRKLSDRMGGGTVGDLIKNL